MGPVQPPLVPDGRLRRPRGEAPRRYCVNVELTRVDFTAMSGPTFETLIQAAQKEVLDSYKKEFDSLVGSFRDLDSKAQGTVAIAGVFLAAALAFMNREGVLNSYVSRNLAIFIVLSRTAAIAFSVQALRIRRLPNLPSGDDVSGL